MSIIISLIVFSLIVIVHEFGHFAVAKKVGICVQEFSVGMGPLLFSRQKGETQYSVRALPFGGFCRMQGEEGDDDDGSKDYDPSRSFNSKTILRRFAVLFAGPGMNFVLAFVLLFIMLGVNGFFLPEVNTVYEGTPAEAAGLQYGDRILKLNGTRLHIYQDYSLVIANYASDEPVDYLIERNGEKLNVTIQPEYNEEEDRYMVGFTFNARSGLFGKQVEGYNRATVADTINADIWTMNYFVKSVVVGFVKLFTFQVKSNEISGPIGMVSMIGDTYEAGLKYSLTDAIMNMATFSALLSTNLGIINLFPIPAMDGGRIAFLLIEGIRRKPVDPEIEGRIHLAGFMLLMACMILIAFNDIVNIIR